ncbi:SEC-C motif domain protein [Ammonifex degensii KC4]|uniref:SEC-C motif domain protein n=1 Tax=Ammonifex degensii (strain DSM 10501 / KC4) TaxID=429009 RepID=C9R8B3_AMMDK|nr:SEC-C motif domain protein [Ammonifex degensii KC4]
MRENRPVVDEERLWIRFPGGAGKVEEKRSYPLELPHLNGDVRFVLSVEKRGGVWGVREIRVDEEESDADPWEALGDLAALRWYVLSREERRRELPPLLGWWDEGDLTVAACLPEEFGEKRPFAEQAGKDSLRDKRAWLCWWPSPAAWEASRRVVESTPLKRFEVNFFTFNEWIRRPDVLEEEREGFDAEFEGEDLTPEERESLRAFYRADTYARYLRRIRTMLLHFELNGRPVELKVGNVERARAFFREKGLSPLDPAAWAAASHAFDEMPECVLEVLDACGPLGEAVSPTDLKAAIGLYSHMPGSPQLPDFVGAAVCAGSQQVFALAAWLNPLRGEEALDAATEAVMEELTRRGVSKVAVISEEFLPIDVCPCCGKLTLRVPTEWLKPQPVRKRKVGRNDPCPCGSGLKYKKCCGKNR